MPETPGTTATPPPTSATATADERRSTFRINEAAWVECVSYPDSNDETGQELPVEQLFSDVDSFLLTSEIQRLDLEFESLLNSRNDLDPLTSDLIKLLNRKINAAASLIVSNANQTQPQHITLSEEGLSFVHSEKIGPGSQIVVRLRFKSDNVGVVVKAKVIYQTPDENGFRTGCQLIDVDEATQQLLSRHILGFQARLKRSQQ